LVSATKDPVKVHAGQLGGRARWGFDHDARVVKLDSLTPSQRQLVLALVRAAKDQATMAKREAAPIANGTASEVRDATTPPFRSS